MLFRPLLSPNWNAANTRTARKQSAAIRNLLVGRALFSAACMFLLAGIFLRVAARVADPPDGIRAVIGDKQRAIRGHGDADGASPDVAVVYYKPGDEVLVLAAGTAGLVHGDANHFIAGADGAVPGAVFGGEDIAAIFSGKLGAFIEGDFERSIVGLEEYVRNDCLVFQFGVLAVVARILVAADVPPRPAIETSVLNMSNVVGDKIVSQAVALVDGTPELAGFRIGGQAAAGISDSVGVYAHLRAVRIELQNIGAVLFFGGRIGVVDIRCRADGDEHFFAVGGELHIAGPMAAGGKIGNMPGRAGGFQVSILIGKADDSVRVADVDPLRFISRRIKGDAVGTVEPFNEDRSLPGLAIGCDATEDLDFAAAAFSQKQIAVGGGADQTRIVESLCVELDGESVRPFRPRIIGTRHQLRTIVGRIGSVRRGKVLGGNFTELCWLLDTKIRVRGFGKRRVCFHGSEFLGRRAGLACVRGVL